MLAYPERENASSYVYVMYVFKWRDLEQQTQSYIQQQYRKIQNKTINERNNTLKLRIMNRMFNFLLKTRSK
jgi:hypothetical protein